MRLQLKGGNKLFDCGMRQCSSQVYIGKQACGQKNQLYQSRCENKFYRINKVKSKQVNSETIEQKSSTGTDIAEQEKLVELNSGTETMYKKTTESPIAAMFEAQLGIKLSPEVAAIALVYLVQGMLGLSSLAVSYYFKDDLHLSPAELSFYTGITTIPWIIKPVYGIISDTFPVMGFKRRSYLIFCGLLGAASWATIAGGTTMLPVALVCLFGGSMAIAFSDVVVDSIVVERVRGEPQQAAASFQSLCWGAQAAGSVLSAYFSGSLVQNHGPYYVFGITAVFPLLAAGSAFLINEQRVVNGWNNRPALPEDLPTLNQAQSRAIDSDNNTGELLRKGRDKVVKQLITLWRTVKQRHILYPALFATLWQATPSADGAMFYFYTDTLHFNAEFLGYVKFLSALARLGGVALYGTFLRNVPLKKVFFGTGILGAALSATQLLLITGVNRQLGLSDELFVLGDTAILTVLGQISFMPVMVLAARLCPEGVEATLFATLMSLFNAGSITGGAVGAQLTNLLGVTSDDMSNLALLQGICCVSLLLPLPFVGMLPREPPKSESANDKQKLLDESEQ